MVRHVTTGNRSGHRYHLSSSVATQLERIEQGLERLQQSQDVMRQSTLGLLIEEVRALDGRVKGGFDGLADEIRKLREQLVTFLEIQDRISPYVRVKAPRKARKRRGRK